ncbi:TlpA disulfide reductase family protein [Ekhidna sp.]|uniref:TlpA family protein disulfide reductase n=1 Tax=Ekhidna sp. TaxID=2608089 RepID=UPI0032EFAA2B
MKKLFFNLFILTSAFVNAQSFEGEWKGSYVLNANVVKFTIFVLENNGVSEVKLDVPDSKVFNLEYQITRNGDSITFSRINSQGYLAEFKGLKNGEVITGSITIHSEYLKDNPGLFQLMKSNAKIIRGRKMPNFNLETMNGVQISNEDFKNQYYMLDFWATWCAPCVAKRPKLEALKEKFDDRIQIVSISLDKDVQTVEDFRSKKYPMSWYHVVKSKKFKDPFIKEYLPSGLPYGYLVNNYGEVVAFGAELNADNIDNTINRVLK